MNTSFFYFIIYWKGGDMVLKGMRMMSGRYPSPDAFVAICMMLHVRQSPFLSLNAVNSRELIVRLYSLAWLRIHFPRCLSENDDAEIVYEGTMLW